MSLDELRDQINQVDAGIVRLLARRVGISKKIGAEKKRQRKPVHDPRRERVVLDRVRTLARDLALNPDDVEEVYRQIITTSKGVQGIDVAFQGEIGAYSEEAAFRFFGNSINVKPCENLDHVFSAVETGEVPYGIVPIENSLEGSISRTYDLLLDSSPKVCGETELRVIHCLIAHPEATIESIKRVYSHPQALGQCGAFLRHLGRQLVPTYDTAGSVKMIKEQGITDGAAIASARAARVYGMKVLAREIEDNPHNFTRFFVLAKADSPRTGRDKTSIVFSVQHRPGALHQLVKEFAARNINLTKIESRPTRQKPWEYNFYLDFEGHRLDKAAKEALATIDSISLFVKVLGSYPRAR